MSEREQNSYYYFIIGKAKTLWRQKTKTINSIHVYMLFYFWLQIYKFVSKFVGNLLKHASYFKMGGLERQLQEV